MIVNPSAKTRYWQAQAAAKLKPVDTTKPVAATKVASKPVVESREAAIAETCAIAGCENMIAAYIASGQSASEVLKELTAERGNTLPWSEIIGRLEKAGGK